MANVTKLYPDLQKFIDGERDSYENTNGFAFSLEQVGRYADFLDVIAERFFPKAAELRDRLVASMDGASKGDFGAMVDDMAIRRRLGVEIDLDIESYFQFAKILLDKVGHFLEDYFGPGRAASLNSHHKAQKSIESFVAQKQIELPEGMIDRMKALQAISDWFPESSSSNFFRGSRASRSLPSESNLSGCRLIASADRGQPWFPIRVHRMGPSRGIVLYPYSRSAMLL